MMKKSLINYSLYQRFNYNNYLCSHTTRNFAIEIEQTNTENMSLSANEEQMKKAFARCWFICKSYE